MSEKKEKRSKFGLFFFIISFTYILIFLATGLNALAPFAMVLCFLAALIIFIRTVLSLKWDLYYLLSYIYILIETALYFIVWGADDIGKILWYNMILAGLPLICALFIVLARKKYSGGMQKFTAALSSILMMTFALVYVFFMSLRAKPAVDSLQAGHDAYLASITSNDLSANAPNVLVILMDDMGYSDISSYSYMAAGGETIQTPNIDSLAADGLLMENFYSSAPVCTPSRFSMLTGRYAARGYLDNVIFPTVYSNDPYSITHMVNPYQFPHNVDGLLGDEITMAEVLQASGYNTACIGKWNLGDYGEYLPTNQGFDYFYGSYYVNDMTPYNWVRETNGKAVEVRSHAENLDQSESTRLFTDEINGYIETSVDNSEKFFMYYTSPWPHYPIYSDKDGNGKGDTSDDSYIDCIEEFDSYLGTTIQLLKDKGVYDDTLIIFTSDNGPGREGVTGAMRGRKNTTFEGGMKVPMTATYVNGGITAGTVIESPAMNIDFLPTILSYVGIDSLPSDRIIDGVSLKALWNGEISSDARVHSALYYMKRGKVQAVQMPVETGGVTHDYKYYERVHSENSAFFDQFYNNYLFNLDTDPAEGYNISMINPEIAETLYIKLTEFRQSLSDNRRGIK